MPAPCPAAPAAGQDPLAQLLAAEAGPAPARTPRPTGVDFRFVGCAAFLSFWGFFSVF